MDYVRLGETGLKVSRLALGCMSYGDPKTAGAHKWSLDDEDAQPFFRQAVELGITFWDTANTYQLGTSEEVVGRAITRYSRREDVVLATKVFGRMHDGPGGQGLSRKAILEQVDASLTRLATDYIDLYQIHRFDPEAPVEETMEALHDIVKAGKVRYIGASSMYAWQFAKLQHAADLHGWTRFVSMQNQYNLLRRQDERELMAMCADMGVGIVPYSPQGKGRLASSLRRAVTPLRRGPRGPVLRLTARRACGERRPAHRRGPWRHHGPGGARVGAEESRCLGTHCGSDQAPSPAGSHRGAGSAPHRGRDSVTRGAVHTPRAVLVLTNMRRSAVIGRRFSRGHIGSVTLTSNVGQCQFAVHPMSGIERTFSWRCQRHHETQDRTWTRHTARRRKAHSL